MKLFKLLIIVVLIMVVFCGNVWAQGHWANGDLNRFIENGFIKSVECLDNDIPTEEFNNLISKIYGNEHMLDESKAFVTREEAIAILSKANKIETKKFNNNVDEFKMYPYVIAMINKGFLNGYPNYYGYRLKEYITYAETLKLMSLIFGDIINEDSDNLFCKNVLINHSGIKLENSIIEGDLIVRIGIGAMDITLNNVIVNGKVLIFDSEGQKIYFNDCMIEEIVVCKSSEVVTLIALGETYIEKASMHSDVKIIQEGRFYGFNNIVIKDSLNMFLNGRFKQIEIANGNALINLESGTLINRINAFSPVEFKGNGKVSYAKVKSEGVIFTRGIKRVIKDKEIAFYLIGTKIYRNDYKFVKRETIKDSNVQSNSQYDLYTDNDLELSIQLNGNSIVSVKDSNGNVEHIISGDYLIIKEDYMQQLDIGNHSLHIDFSGGNDKEVNIEVVDSEVIINNSLVQETAQYDLYTDNDLEISIQLNGNELVSIKDHNDNVISILNYIKEINSVIFNKEFMQSMSVGSYEWIFDFNQGEDRSINVSIIDSKPYVTSYPNTMTIGTVLSYDSINDKYHLCVLPGLNDPNVMPMFFGVDNITNVVFHGDLIVDIEEGENITILNLDIEGELTTNGTGNLILINVN